MLDILSIPGLFEHGNYNNLETKSVKLNTLLGGDGFRTGQLIVFQAGSGCGKTTTLCSLAIKAALEGKRSMYISCEQSRKSIAEIMGCMMCNYNYSEFTKTYDPKQVENVQSKLQSINGNIDIRQEKHPFHLNEVIQDNIRKDYYNIQQTVKEAIREDIQFIFFDYIGAVLPEDNTTTYALYTKIADWLQEMAEQHHLCIITAMQTTRQFRQDLKQENFDPASADETYMADSIGPMRKADTCITIFEYKGQKYLNLFKNRLTGDLGCIKIKMDDKHPYRYSWSDDETYDFEENGRWN